MADESPPDALLIPEAKKRGRTMYQRMCSHLDLAEPILGVDRASGGRAYLRRQGDGWVFASASPDDTLYFPLTSPLRGRPRYAWTDGADGIRRGRLVPEARPVPEAPG